MISPKIRIAGQNISGGLRDKKQHTLKTLRHFRNIHRIDILVCEETLLQQSDVKLTEQFTTYMHATHSVHSWAASSHKGGISILCFNKDIKIIDVDFTTEGFAFCKIEWQGQIFTLVGVYLPTKGDKRIQAIEKLGNSDEHDLCSTSIFIGDYNFVENLKTDKINSSSLGGRHGAPEFAESIADPLDLTDAWRYFNPTKRGATYTDRARRGIRTRLDRAYVTPDLLPFISHPRHIPYACSDHDAIMITLSAETEADFSHPRHIFDDGLLTDRDFCTELTQILEHKRPASGPNLLKNFDSFLGKIENACIKHAKLKKLSTIEQQQHHTKRIEAIDTNIETLSDRSDELEEALIDRELAQADLNQFECSKAKSTAERQRANWNVEGEETPSKKLTSLLKGKHAKTTIHSTQVNGRITRDMKEILKSGHSYYSELYSQRVNHACPSVQSARQRLLSSITKKLSAESKDKLDLALQDSELLEAIEDLSPTKVPGSDGITVRLYREFWEHLGPILLQVWNESLAQGHLPASMSKALVTLIHKKNERHLWKNYRPISLLNISYKIYSKVLANRLKKVLNEVVNEDQTGCVPGRFIGENIMLYLESYEYMKKNNKSGAYLFLDFEKAFDRVDRDFMWSTMEHMNFGSDFISYCKTLYDSSCSDILVNGHHSPRVSVQTGVRQGCPIAALLYLLACEPMANMFRENPNFTGMKLPNSQAFQGLASTHNQQNYLKLAISQYCDDTLLFCNDASDVKIAVETLQLYELATGQKINYSKSPALYLRMQEPPNVPFAKMEDDDAQRVLGLNVGVNFNYLREWDEKKGKLNDLYAAFSRHNMSIFGRVVTARTYAISKLWFCAQFYSPGAKWLDGLERIYEKYCFNKTLSETDRYIAGKRKLLYLPKDKHGYGAMHIPSQWTAFLGQWVSRLASPSVTKWKAFVLAGLEDNRNGWSLGVQAAISTTIPINHIRVSNRWKQILIAARSIEFSPTPSQRTAMHQPLFHNPESKHFLTSPSYARFSRVGIRVVADLYKPCITQGKLNLDIINVHDIHTKLQSIHENDWSLNTLTTKFNALLASVADDTKLQVSSFMHPAMRDEAYTTRYLDYLSPGALAPTLLQYTMNKEGETSFKICNQQNANIIITGVEVTPFADQVTPSFLSITQTKAGLMAMPISFSTESLWCPGLNVSPHSEHVDKAPAFSLTYYSVKAASKLLLTTFLQKPKNKDLNSHMDQWKEDPLTPAGHTPKLVTHLQKCIPAQLRARLQRIYLRNLSTGHYHRHMFANSNHCHMCKTPAHSPRPPETPQHLFHSCKTAKKIWARVQFKLWPRNLWRVFPNTPYPHINGDVSFITPAIPGETVWNILHACTVSGIYTTRCRVAFDSAPTPPWQRLSAEAVAHAHSKLADCIRASWKLLVASPADVHGVNKFKKIWCSSFDEFYCKIHNYMDQRELELYQSGVGEEPTVLFRMSLASKIS